MAITEADKLILERIKKQRIKIIDANIPDVGDVTSDPEHMSAVNMVMKGVSDDIFKLAKLEQDDENGIHMQEAVSAIATALQKRSMHDTGKNKAVDFEPAIPDNIVAGELGNEPEIEGDNNDSN